MGLGIGFGMVAVGPPQKGRQGFGKWFGNGGREEERPDCGFAYGLVAKMLEFKPGGHNKPQ